MKRFFHITMALMTIMLIAGCDDGPSQKTDYGKLKLGRLDIKDAVSLGLSTESSSRAIDGEFLSAGLYKIDAAGNITAVGVYFTTDTLGNKLEHEEKLKVVPEKIFDLSENYIYLMHCDYYDSDGDHVEDRWEYDYDDNSYLVKQDVPYKDLLVRKSDGKIWCVDNISHIIIGRVSYNDIDLGLSLLGEFKEDRYGTLYFKHFSNVYKFNLYDDSSSFEQITNNSGDPNYYSDFFITDNGVVCDYDYYESTMHLSWPHSGFQGINYFDICEDTDITDLERTIPVGSHNFDGDYITMRPQSHRINDWIFGNYNNSPILLFNCMPSFYADKDGREQDVASSNFTKDELDQSNWPFGSFYTINIGTSPGSAALCDTPIQLTSLPEDSEKSWSEYISSYPRLRLFTSAYIGTNYILTSGYNGWISKIDLDKREWKWLKKLDFDINFYGSISYDGKVWSIDDSREHFGAYWFDPVSLEDGFVKFNVDIPSFMNIHSYHQKNGKITYSGTDPATGHNVTIVIDLPTGEALSDESAPDLLFQNLINLN